MVTGSRDAVRVARRMITGLEKQAGLLRGSAWALVTGRAELLRQWEQWWDSSGRQPGDRRTAQECGPDAGETGGNT